MLWATLQEHTAKPALEVGAHFVRDLLHGGLQQTTATTTARPNRIVGVSFDAHDRQHEHQSRVARADDGAGVAGERHDHPVTHVPTFSVDPSHVNSPSSPIGKCLPQWQQNVPE